MVDYNPAEGRYKIFDKNIPDDNYGVVSVIQDMDGTKILLRGKFYSVEIIFGSIQCLSVCDEGVRIRSYNEIVDLQFYRRNKFKGNPFYAVENSDFKKWLAYESCGFSRNLTHFAVITTDDFIDISAPFSPEIKIKEI